MKTKVKIQLIQTETETLFGVNSCIIKSTHYCDGVKLDCVKQGVVLSEHIINIFFDGRKNNYNIAADIAAGLNSGYTSNATDNLIDIIGGDLPVKCPFIFVNKSDSLMVEKQKQWEAQLLDIELNNLYIKAKF
jgi:hypothetical protein